MIQSIGETAGKVYHALQSEGPLTLTRLKTSTGRDAFTLNAAIGWLAREDKIIVTKKGRSVTIALR